MEFDGGHRSPTIADFASAKQDLYDAIGDLVIASQEITAEEKETKEDVATLAKSRRKRGSEGVRKVIKAGESLKIKVHSVCLNVSFMVEEDKIRRRKSSGNDTTPSFMTISTAGRYFLLCPALTIVLQVKKRVLGRNHRLVIPLRRSRRSLEMMRPRRLLYRNLPRSIKRRIQRGSSNMIWRMI